MVNMKKYKIVNKVGMFIDRIMNSILIYIIIISIIKTFIKIDITNINIFYILIIALFDIAIMFISIILGVKISDRMKWHYYTKNNG